jgi:outer membrane receptor protein involved in Fe transport
MLPLLFALLLNAETATPAQGQPISGTVVDSQARVIAGAVVRLEVAGVVVAEVETGGDGRFAFNQPSAVGARLIATAPGFAQATLLIAGGGSVDVMLTMQPAPFFEAVQVTTSRGYVAQPDVTVTAAVYPASTLIQSGPLSLDDALEMVPGFTVFPSSRVANPSTQTVTLRGLGGSGVNRSLVLADGIPLNDAFGGWVYWDKVPQAAIDRVEVLRGGGSDLYGADAVGGVVQILTLRPDRTLMRALLEAGTLETGRVSLFAGTRHGGWSLGGAGQWFSTAGYMLPPADERGLVDRPAGSAHRSVFGWVSHQAESWTLALRGDVFSEDRQNGTVLQVNDTDARHGSVELSGRFGEGFLSARASASTQGYDQTFSDIGEEPPRDAEVINRIQRIPASVVEASVQWVRPWGPHTLLIGAEGRSVESRTSETRFGQSRVPESSRADGRARVGSAFVRTRFVPADRLTIAIGSRGDVWRSSSDTSSFTQTIGSITPRVSVAYLVGRSGLTVRGSAYGGFRSPTLNELYRSVQIGNDVTAPNERLTPERLRAGDAGIALNRGRLSARITGFWSVLTDTITNVTLSTSPSLNVRQRQNAARMRSAGIEMEADVRLPGSLSVAVSSALLDSRFTGGSRLRDLRVPQVAHASLGVDVRYAGPAWTASTQFRLTGSQFDDDVNTRRLRRAAVLDVFGGRTFARRALAFVAVENILDREYDISRTPFRALGLPRAVRGGLQLTFP